jgi:hypothetical protein
MRKSLFSRPAWALALCFAGAPAAAPLSAQSEALLSGINRNVGASWTEVDLPAPPNGGFDAACEIAVEDDGTVHLVYESSVCTGGICSADAMSYTSSGDGGASWSTPVQVRNFNLVRGSGAHCPVAQDQWCIQIRIAFSTDYNNDSGDDYIGYYSSNNATAANHPQLVVTYQ